MVSGIRNYIEDGIRNGWIGVFAETDGGFRCTNRLTRPGAILIQARLKTSSFTQRSFPKHKPVISKLSSASTNCLLLDSPTWKPCDWLFGKATAINGFEESLPVTV